MTLRKNPPDKKKDCSSEITWELIKGEEHQGRRRLGTSSGTIKRDCKHGNRDGNNDTLRKMGRQATEKQRWKDVRMIKTGYKPMVYEKTARKGDRYPSQRKPKQPQNT